jgi:hypothetical protein
MPVIYDSKKLIPAPFVSVNKQYEQAGDGTTLGSTFNITIQGTIVAHMGSPNSSGELWDQIGYPPDESILHDSRMGAILRKQDAIRNLFSQNGKSLEITPLDGTQPMKCYPTVLDINFPEGIWVDTCPYTITLSANTMYPEVEDEFLDYIKDASENWQIETDESTAEGIGLPQTYRITHSLSAVGKRSYDAVGNLNSEAWEQARNWVQRRTGFDEQIALSSGVMNLPSYYGGWNLTKTEQIDKYQGSYFVTETWILASGSALETFSVESVKGIDSPFTQVSVQGDINGLALRSDNNTLVTNKYDNAVTKFNQVSGVIFSRAQNYSNISLNMQPLNVSISRSPVGGNISYTYSYDNRPSNIIPTAHSEMINISENLVGQSYATIFILGRANGPILQNLNTRPAATRTLNIELVMPTPSFGSNSVADIRSALFSNPRLNPATSAYFANIWYAADPSQQGYTKVFQDQPNENWNPKTGQYSYTQQWTFEYST